MMMSADKIQMIHGKRMLLHVENNKLPLIDWFKKNKDNIDSFLSTDGALLIRGLKVDSNEQFGKVLSNLFGDELIKYTFRSTPRTELANNVYTASEYHPSETIPQHNENSYSNSWPMRIGFLCMVPPGKMGNTPISDSRIVFQRIPEEIRDEFEKKKIMYVRNYSKIDLSWQEVFQTSDKNIVEKYCEKNNIKWQWTDEGLRTKQVNQAVIIHPFSKEKLWFNQAHLFHISSLEDNLQEGLIALMGEENLPRNAYFGDGTQIDVKALSVIREVYEKTMVSFQWQKYDLLLLDNMLFTHGREPFEGARQILVAMTRKYCP